MLKKISAFLLSVTIILSLFASSFSSLALTADDVILPDGEVLAAKEVTKDISLSDMKFVYLAIGTTNSVFTQQQFQDHITKTGTLLSGGQELTFTVEEMQGAALETTTSTQATWFAFYPLTENQTLKSFSYRYKQDETGFFYLTESTSSGKMDCRRFSRNQAGITNAVTSQLNRNLSVTSDILSGFGDSDSGNYSTPPVTSWTDVKPEYFAGSDGLHVYEGNAFSEITVALDYSNENVVNTKVTKVYNGSYFTKDNVNYLSKNFPMVVGQIKDNGASVSCFADMQIVYTEPYDITDDVKAFVAEHPLALDIRNGAVDFSDISTADEASAQALKDAYDALTDTAFKTALSNYGYYNETTVQKIIAGGDKAIYKAMIAEDGSLTYFNDFESGEDFVQVHTITYPYDESKTDFPLNGQEFVNTVPGITATPSELKSSSRHNSNNVYKFENRFYYNIYGKEYLLYDNMTSASKALWSVAEEQGLNLDHVSGYINAGDNSWTYAVGLIYSYTDRDHYSVLVISGVNSGGSASFTTQGFTSGNFSVLDYTVDLTAENDKDKIKYVSSPNVNIGYTTPDGTSNTDEWVKFEISYDEDGYVNFAVVNGNNRYTYKTTNTVAPENRFFAISKRSGCNANGNYLKNPIYFAGTSYFDDVEISFKKDTDETLGTYSEALDFRETYKELLARNAEFAAPYDKTASDAAQSAYASLSDGAKAYLTDAKTKLDEFAASVNAWDTTSDDTVAASFRAKFPTVDSSNVKVAYNVYNRLTASQKALLSSEYGAILNQWAATEKDENNTTDIAVLGDSNTYGYGITDRETNRWTTLLANKLGSGYTVANGGVSGYRMVYDTANITGIQFRDDNSKIWTQSHSYGYDMIIVALGTNDSSVNSQENADKWEAVYEEFIQSYLAVENSPTIILANFGRTQKGNLTAHDDGFNYRNGVIKKLADKYGLTLLDFDAMYRYDADNYLLQSDNLHWNAAGHVWMADKYYDAITAVTANQYSLAGQKVFYDYDAAKVTQTVNDFAPTLVSATIRAKGTQDIRFKATLGSNITNGKEVAEYGMVIADYRNITNGTLTVDDLTCDTTSENIIVAKSSEADNNDLGTTFYVNIGGLNDSTYGVPFIARAYVKYTDGTVYYSSNTNAAGDYAARTGVKDGCAVRSVISIAKAMTVALSQNGVDVSSVAKVEDGKITAYVDENGTETTSPSDNGARLFALISENKSVLESK